MKESLSKHQILGKRDLQRVFKTGTKHRVGSIGFFVCKNLLGFSRMGVSVTRKYGNAVHRNYAKRVIRELFRKYKSLLKIHSDVVFVIHPHPLTYTRTEVAVREFFSRNF